jgi:hypothetical protein
VPPPVYPDTHLSFLANVYNHKARAFYQRYGVELIDAAYVHATADREGYAVIAFFRADVDCFRTCVQHHRAHFEVIACAHAAGLGAVIGIFQPVTFGVEA